MKRVDRIIRNLSSLSLDAHDTSDWFKEEGETSEDRPPQRMMSVEESGQTRLSFESLDERGPQMRISELAASGQARELDRIESRDRHRHKRAHERASRHSEELWKRRRREGEHHHEREDDQERGLHERGRDHEPEHPDRELHDRELRERGRHGRGRYRVRGERHGHDRHRGRQATPEPWNRS